MIPEHNNVFSQISHGIIIMEPWPQVPNHGLKFETELFKMWDALQIMKGHVMWYGVMGHFV